MKRSYLKDRGTIIATPEALAAAFTEWERLWREDPGSFMSDMERLEESTTTYGEVSAAYLIELLDKLYP